MYHRFGTFVVPWPGSAELFCEEESESDNMSEEEMSERQQELHDGETRFDNEIDKEISKLKYFLEETDQLIQTKDYAEIENVNERAGKIVNKLSDLISPAEDRQWDIGVLSGSEKRM